MLYSICLKSIVKLERADGRYIKLDPMYFAPVESMPLPLYK